MNARGDYVKLQLKSSIAETGELTLPPNGYKLTEFGPLPEEWKVVRLGDVATVRYGKARPKGTGVIPVVGSGGVYAWTKKALVDFPTLVIGRKGTAGTVWLQEQPCWPSDTTFYLEWETDGLDHRFVYHFLQERPLSGEHAKTTLPSLQRPDLVNYLLPLPPFPEQRAIAHVLRTVQEAKEATERVIAALRELKKSLMRHLFTYGPVPVDAADQVELQDSPIGPIPAHWRVVRLGEVCDLYSGFAFRSKDFKTKGIPVVKIGNLQNGTVVINNNDSHYPPELWNPSLEKYLLNSGDVLIALTGATTGKIAKVPNNVEGALLNQRVGKFSVLHKSKFDLTFAFYLFDTPLFQKQIKETILQSAQGNVSPIKIKNFLIPLPPLDEQRKIARMLQAIDRKIEAEEARKEALDALFSSLLHHLMTAKIRLPAEFIAQFKEEGP